MFSRKHHPFSRSWMPTSLHRRRMRTQSTPTVGQWPHSLGGTQPPCGLPSRPRTTASRVQLQVMASVLPRSVEAASLRLEHLGATF